MNTLILATFLTFLSYYFASLERTNTNTKLLFIISFIICSFILRSVLTVNLNNDYYLYYNFSTFKKPDSLLSYFVNEPYLYGIYSIFELFLDSKNVIFLGMYWFNFLLNSLFFIWILTRRDVEPIKKIILFVLHYFMFGFVVLRNGPSYMLFAMFFYYALRDKKFNWVWITPIMHISSCLMLVTYFHKNKYYYKAITLVFFTLLFFSLFCDRYLINLDELGMLSMKIDFYSKGMKLVGIMHYVFFIFVYSLIIAGFVLYKKKLLHPILVTTILFYTISFFINPIVASRFSPYLFFSILLAPFVTMKFEKKINICTYLSVFLYPIFLYTMYLTHKSVLLIDLC